MIALSRLAIVSIALFTFLLVGLIQEPDSGTAASVGPPDVAEATVGPNIAKPLPRVLTASTLLALWRVLTPTVLALALLQLLVGRPPAIHGRDEADDRDRSALRSVARQRRGPPAVVG
ncbi:MAG TPA: hypothetical protein VIL48_03205 [Acidimicrobiales bacterium]